MSTLRITGVFDNSGYGVANKATAVALIDAGFDVTTGVITTNMSRMEFAQDKNYAAIVKRISNKKPKVEIVQLVPRLWQEQFQRGVYNIGYFFWESDKICDSWIEIINNGLCNEVWVPCQSNYDALINSGVKKPIYIVPQYTQISLMNKELAQKILPIPNDGTYNFYSIFQWTQRKNPGALFQAYFNEFSNEENVMLVVKTYGPSPFADRRRIKEFILNTKEKSGSTAPVYLFGELMTAEQVNAIHPQCHCYVYSGRGEGWNIPLLESMAYKKQIITTKTGGIADWITNESAYIIPHTLIPIDAAGQAWGWFYQSDPPQKWGEVRVEDVQKAMRQAYNERNNYAHRINHYNDVLKISSKNNIINIMKERLARVL